MSNTRLPPPDRLPARQTALVTGASAGIGQAMARLLAKRDYDLILVARREALLRDTARELRDDCPVRVEVVPADLCRDCAAGEVFQAVRDREMSVDVLINSAGFGTQGAFAEADADEQNRLLHVNIVSLTQLTRLFLPGMLTRRRGGVINLASIAAYMPGPLMATYFASKAFVLSFTEALANELAGTGVRATALCPGPTQSEFADRAGIASTKAFAGGVMDVAAVAKAGFDGFTRGKRVVVPGLKTKAGLYPAKFMPRRMLAFFARQYNTVPAASPPIGDAPAAVEVAGAGSGGGALRMPGRIPVGRFQQDLNSRRGRDGQQDADCAEEYAPRQEREDDHNRVQGHRPAEDQRTHHLVDGEA
jgi:short-subunit dehydrogenase